MLIKRVSKSDFIQAFVDMRKDDFSLKALEAIYEYLEELSEETGEDVELDVIAICCGFTEINFAEVLEYHGEDDRDYALDEYEHQLEEDYGWVARLPDSFVYQG